MRITIDTDLQVIIVPDSYYMQVDKMNAVIAEAGGTKLDYNSYIKSSFEKAMATQVIRQSDVAKMRGVQGKRRNVAKGAEKKMDVAPEASE